MADGWEYATAYHDLRRYVRAGHPSICLVNHDGIGDGAVYRVSMKQLVDCMPEVSEYMLAPERELRAKVHVCFAAAARGLLPELLAEG